MGNALLLLGWWFSFVDWCTAKCVCVGGLECLLITNVFDCAAFSIPGSSVRASFRIFQATQDFTAALRLMRVPSFAKQDILNNDLQIDDVE